MATVDADRAKKIRLYKNGDPNFLGKDFVLNKRKIRTWDSFLNTATVGLKASFPVRAICTPNHGHRIQSLDDFEDSKQYVALGYGKFRNLGYTELDNHAPRKDQSPPRQRQVEVRPVEHSKRYQQTSGRFRKVPTDVLTIFVYANGKELEKAQRLTLTHNMMRNWDGILKMITDKVNLRSGAARKVYTMQGELVTDPRQFENGAYYIAVGADVGGLKMVNYGQMKPDFHTSPKAQRNPFRKVNKISHPWIAAQIQINYPRFGSKQRKSRASDNSTTDSNATEGRGFGLSGKGGPSPASDRTPVRQSRPPRKKEATQRKGPPGPSDDSVFHAKAVKHQVKDKNQREVDFGKDDDGVFKARGVNRETSGAREVEDTRDTRVDLPIDQVEAEEVKEEEGLDSHSAHIEDDHNLTKDPSPEAENTGQAA